jgi:molybdopterin biosynthesis enzyme
VIRTPEGVRLAGGQDSNVLSAAAAADALAVVDVGVSAMNAGDTVPLLEIRLPASRTFEEVLG